MALNGEFASELVRNLGLDGFRPLGSGETYFEFIPDSISPWVVERKGRQYEIDILDDLKYDRSQDLIQTWLMFGAIREDDNPSEDPPTPQDVAPGLRRPLHHFYDPYFNRPLTFPGLSTIDSDVHKNPDWAIGSRNSFEDPNAPEFLRRNSFSIFDGREAMFRALTLQTFDGAGYADVASGVDLATRQHHRQAYWATTFRALGDVLHLNQDMAQPQHTRNEPHSGKYCPTAEICLTGHTSVYEKYVNARALTSRTFESKAPFDATVSITPAALPMGTYPIPAFAKYTDYWSTAAGNQAVAGKGLADYSNRGFFTARKNLGSSEYPSPPNDASSYDIRSFIPTRWDGSTPTDETPTHVYYGPVSDAWQQTSTPDVPLTTYSLWDQFLLTQTANPTYSLNRLNYDAMADLLLPRAVAYSAGLINFFFRGRIDIALPDEGVFALADHATDAGFTMLRAKIRNATPTFVDPQGDAQPQHMSGGQFFAVVRYHRDRKYVASLDTVVGAAPCTDPSIVVNPASPGAWTDCRSGVEEIAVSRPLYGVSLQANEQKTMEFEFGDAPIPFDMTDVALQVVYRGELGTEADAVAVGTMDVSEPTYFAYQNASDYIHLGDHVYTRGQIESDVGLLSQVRPQYCVDYDQSPPRLLDGCLRPFALDLTVSFGDIANPAAMVTALPNRRFIRFVYLTIGDEGFDPPAMKKTSGTVKVAARRHGGDEKALLNQDGTCLPHDPFIIAPRHSQLSMISANEIYYRVDRLGTLRGVNGWYSAACVVNGDESDPGTPDDRADVMTPLTPLSEEVLPYALTIMPDYL